MVKYLNLETKINLTNLFEKGDKVPWPSNNEPGFLSFRRCPALWQLGARPNITAAYDKQYLEGRYGADPYLTNMLAEGKWQ